MRSRFVLSVVLLVFVFLATACGPATEIPTNGGDEPVVQPENQGQPYPYPSSNEIFLPVTGSEPAYPAPELPVNAIEPYPDSEVAPDMVGSEKVLEFSEVIPMAEDKNLASGAVFIEGTYVDILESDPVQVRLVVDGNLPTPCHQLRVTVSEPDQENRIIIHAYSVSNPETMCVQVLEPFTVVVPIENLIAGKYMILINDQQALDFEFP